MEVSTENKAAQSFRRLLPFLTALTFLGVSAFVWPIPFWGQVAPALGLVAIYYWSMYRPDLLRPLIVFLLGILNDALHFLPIGLSACVFLIVYQLAYSQRRFFIGQIFFMLWFGFAGAAFVAALISWSFMSFYYGSVTPVMPVFFQYLLTILFFPLPAWLLIKIQRTLLSQV